MALAEGQRGRGTDAGMEPGASWPAASRPCRGFPPVIQLPVPGTGNYSNGRLTADFKGITRRAFKRMTFTL